MVHVLIISYNVQWLQLINVYLIIYYNHDIDDIIDINITPK